MYFFAKRSCSNDFIPGGYSLVIRGEENMLKPELRKFRTYFSGGKGGELAGGSWMIQIFSELFGPNTSYK